MSVDILHRWTNRLLYHDISAFVTPAEGRA